MFFSYQRPQGLLFCCRRHSDSRSYSVISSLTVVIAPTIARSLSMHRFDSRHGNRTAYLTSHPFQTSLPAPPLHRHPSQHRSCCEQRLWHLHPASHQRYRPVRVANLDEAVLLYLPLGHTRQQDRLSCCLGHVLRTAGASPRHYLHRHLFHSSHLIRCWLRTSIDRHAPLTMAV